MDPAADPELAQLLGALCSPEGGTRRGGEEALAAGQLTPGFAGRVAAFAAAGASAGSPAAAASVPLRQMALTIIRQLTLKSWAHVPAGDKTAVRASLLGAVAEEAKGLRGLVHACLAAVQQQDDGPWRELHEQLGAGLARGSPREAACCVECVAVLLDECGTEVALALGHLQEPMLQLAASAASPPELRRRCVDAHIAGVAAILSCRGEGLPQYATESVVGGVPGWLAVHAALCTGVEGWSDDDRVSCAFTALRTVTALSRYRAMEEALAAHIEGVLRPACALVQRIQPGYEEAVILADDGGASEEDGGVSQLIAQLMELLQAMLVMPKMRKLLKSHIANMLRLLVPFMRITEAQARAWHEDPNAFLAQEEDEHVRGCAVRLSGEGLLGELLEHAKREATKALAGIVAELMERGNLAVDKASWKLTEVALFIFAHAAGAQTAKALQRGDLAAVTPALLRLAGRLCADAVTPEFLRARAFAVLRRLGDVVVALVPGDVQQLLGAAAASLGPGAPLVVRVMALRVFCRFLSAVDDMATREACLAQGNVLASLGSLLQHADEEMLHLALESVCLISKQCPPAMVSAEAAFAPLILDIWRRSSSDPLVHLQVLDLVSCAAASDPRLQRSLEGHLLPDVLKDLAPDAEAIKASSAIELYGVLLKRAELPLRSDVLQVLPPLLAAAMKADESALLHNACEVLTSLVQRCPAQLVEQGLPGPILQCVEKLLGPNLDDDACVYVAPLVTLLLDQWASLIPAEMVLGLVGALVTRLARAELPYLQQELIVTLARLLHKDLPGTLQALSGVRVPAAGGRTTAWTGLELLLSVWLARAKEIRAKRARNVTVSALCQLHQRCGQDASLAGLRPGGGEGTVPLAAQLLVAVAAALEFENERCKKLREAEAVSLEDEDDEDDGEEDGEDDELLGCGSGRAGAGKLLSDLVDLEDIDSDDDDEAGGDTFQDLERADPFSKLDLQRYAADYLATSGAAAAAAQPELAQRMAAAVAEAKLFLS